MRKVIRIAAAILVAAYPIAIWAGISTAGSRLASLAILVILAVAIPLGSFGRKGTPPRELWGSGIAIVVLVLLSIWLNDHRFLLAMPVLVNAILLFGFGMSLLAGRRPVVERFARMIHRDLSPQRVLHCRSVTKVWCLFFLVNGMVSLYLALFAPLSAWALYTGGIAYLFMGALFAGEYAIRKIRFG